MSHGTSQYEIVVRFCLILPVYDLRLDVFFIKWRNLQFIRNRLRTADSFLRWAFSSFQQNTHSEVGNPFRGAAAIRKIICWSMVRAYNSSYCSTHSYITFKNETFCRNCPNTPLITHSFTRHIYRRQLNLFVRQQQENVGEQRTYGIIDRARYAHTSGS